jgi:hypothetical protein
MPFVPGTFTPPRVHRFVRFSLEVLSPHFAAQDYAAVTTSADEIRHVFGPANGWPAPGIRFEENLADLERHAREFADRVAFAYAMVSPDHERYLGCLYIKPIKSKLDPDPRKAAFDAQAFFWLSSLANRDSRLAPRVLDDVQAWLKSAWPFRAVAFPGRTIDWAAWERLAAGANPPPA